MHTGRPTQHYPHSPVRLGTVGAGRTLTLWKRKGVAFVLL